MRKQMRNRLGTVAGLTLFMALGLIVVGQMGTGDYSFEAELPLVIGDVTDPYRYNGEEVRELEGSASFEGDPQANTGLLLAFVLTTEESGPIVVGEGRALAGTIRIVMERFVGAESYMSGGLAEDLLLHGDTGMMSSLMPEVLAELAGWGLLDVYVNGELVFNDLPSHFMVIERVRRDESHGYTIFRESDNSIYSPELVDKSGFTYTTQKELHLWGSSSIPGVPISFEEQDVAFHLEFLLDAESEAVAGGGGTPEDPEKEDPEREDPEREDPEKKGPPDNAGPKGNNGLGNGVDDQPPGNPPINDDEESVENGNGSGGKGKGKK